MTDSRAALGNRGGHAESVDRVAAGHPPAREHDTIAVVVEPEGLNGGRRVSAEATAPRPAKARVDRRRRTAMAIIGRGLTWASVLTLGLVAYLVAASALEHGRAQGALQHSFRTPLAFGEAPLGGDIAEGTAVAVLDVPRLGIHQIVVEGTSATQLKKGPGHLRASPLPGQRGNAVIAGRRLAYGGPFLHLDRLRRGDLIRVTTGQGRAVFVVQRSWTVSPHHADPIGPTADTRLTLVTSDPLLLSERRLGATASLRGAAWPAPAGRPTTLHRDELGLQGEPTAITALLLWAEMLALAALATAWLYRRWSRWPAYLICTPVILLLVLLVFDSFSGLLPATL